MAEQPGANLLDLPVELRELIYEQYLAGLVPSTFVLGRDPETPWSNRVLTSVSSFRRTPVLLLANSAVSAEFGKVMLTTLTSGSIPLSQGPTIRIEPGRPTAYHLNDAAKQITTKGHSLPDYLAVILASPSVSCLRLHLVMPQSPSNMDVFTRLIRLISAASYARAEQFKLIRAYRDPMTGGGWDADINAVTGLVQRIRCEKMEWENWYQLWSAASRAAAQGMDISGH